MNQEFSLKVKNYKCFGNHPEGFDQIKPINVIIGKNNSGKSSLIDLIPYVISPMNSDFPSGISTEVIITQRISENSIRALFSDTQAGGIIPLNHFEYGKKFINSKVSYKLSGNGNKLIDMEVANGYPRARPLFEELVRRLQSPFLDHTYYHIAAERNIIPEVVSGNEVKPDGSGITNLIGSIVNNVPYDSKIIERKLFGELKKILEPDIEFIDIIPRKYSTNYWEIFFDTKDETRIALSQMGSGIKTILQVLINLIVLPIFQNKSLEKCVFAFEELENNLHPAMQRRLFEYIKRYTVENKSTLFITTHSNIVIDIFGNDTDSQIIHIKKEDSSTTVKSINTITSNTSVLKDLGIRASDILQTNGVIWVEGPSDRNYLNKWISLVNPELKEGLHYTILPYGGRLLSNFCFDYDWLTKELIPLLKINTNAYVIMDKDGKSASSQLNSTKLRIQDEIGVEKCWITEGREIENYLSKNTLEAWLLQDHKMNKNLEIDPQEKIENILENSIDNKVKYATNKAVYSNEIVKFINSQDLEVLDLKHKINSLVSIITEWNSK